MKCDLCGLSSFRTSKFRPSDVPRLLYFQLPVRCRECSERYYAGILQVMQLRQTQKIRRENERREQIVCE